MYDLIIVGAGPAGLAAAKVVAEYGLSVLVVDEQQGPGGQIFRQPPTAFPDAYGTFTAGYGWGRELVALPTSHTGIEWAFGTTALGVLREPDTDQLLLAVDGPSGARTVAARRLLIATGAYDLPVPIPGGTLPGVMMAGAVQSLLKSQKLLPRGPFVLAGGHPLLFVVADQLLKAGAEISEIAFSRGLPNPREMVASLPAAPGHVGMLTEMTASIARLLARRIPIHTNTFVTAAVGDQRVERVEFTSGNRRHVVDAGTLVLGYGFLPSTELARQAHCDLQWVSRLGGWVVTHDDGMRTSVPDVYVAGEPTGVAGADQSRAEGTIAGLAVVDDLRGAGTVSAAAHKQAHSALRHATRFSVVVQRLFEPYRAALAALATADTIVCRCELVRRGAIDNVLAANPEISSVNAVKLECRSGMGTCQGRYCESTIAALVADARGIPRNEVGLFSAHLPIKPVPLTALTELH